MHDQKRASVPALLRVAFAALLLVPFGCAANDTSDESLAATDDTETQGDEMAAKAEPVADAGSPSGAETPYSVECSDSGECTVDKGTFVGWRTYHAFCHVCHAQDAVGSTFAPSLLDRMNQEDMTLELFSDRLANGFTGQVGVMPPWKDNPNVSKRYGELYAYLMARASGGLKPGRPKKKN